MSRPHLRRAIRWVYVNDIYTHPRPAEWRARLLALGAERTPGNRPLWRVPVERYGELLALVGEMFPEEEAASDP